MEGQEDRQMVGLLDGLATDEGFTESRLAGVHLVRTSAPQPRRPVVYNPGVVIVAQGCKVGYFGDHVHVYDANHYLITSVLLPFECEVVRASQTEPFLALVIGVDMAVLGELLADLGPEDMTSPPQSGVSSSLLPDALREAALRLLACLYSERDSRMLGRQIVREMLYRVLEGEQGVTLRSMAGIHGGLAPIGRALRHIHDAYHLSLDVETLAGIANMSVSVFHQHFKTVTSASPIQYIKSLRLHKARMLMAQKGLAASVAAAEVGYASPSQFSREFKRFFGASPTDEASRMRLISFPK